MKIIDVKTHILKKNIEQPFCFSQGWVYKRSSVIIEIITDEGIVGWGESLCHGLQPPEIAASFIEHLYTPILLDSDPFDVEVLWEKMYNISRPFGGGAAVNAISGIDIALWDVIGKKLNKPVSKLIGGKFRDELTPYATGFYREKNKVYPDRAIEEAKTHLDNGFNAFKLKTGFGVEEDLEYIYAVRDAVGNDPVIMLDANCAYNASEARRLLLELKDANIHFFEEPLAPEDLEGYQEIKNLTSTYVAAGENLFSKYQYNRWISTRALDIIQPDLCSSGGFTELKKIAALAQAWNVLLIPHVWGSGIGLAASMQFIASIPKTPLTYKESDIFLEFDQSTHPFREDLIFNSIRLDNGKVKIPDKPGIGVDVNYEVINEYKVN